MRSTTRRCAGRGIAAVALTCAALGLAGCGSDSGTGSAPSSTGSATPAAKASSAAPKGVHVVDAENTFSLTVPSGWVVGNDPQRRNALKVTGASSATPAPSLSTALESGFDAGAKVVALDPASGGFTSNANVVIQPAKGLAPKDVSQVVAGATKALSALGATDIHSSSTTVDHQPAELLDYHLTPSGSTTQITGRQAYLVNGDSAYVLTVSLAPTADTGIADTIISSLQVGTGAS